MARPVRTGRSRRSRRGQSEIREASIAKWVRAGRCLTNRADGARRGGRSKKADEAVKGRTEGRGGNVLDRGSRTNIIECLARLTN
jgi:hypothetical protein